MAKKITSEVKTRGKRKRERPELPTAIMSLISGLQKFEVINLLEAQFGVSKTTADTVVKQALEKITLASASSSREEIAIARTQLGDLYKKAMDTGQLKVGLSARVERNKLLNLYEADDLTMVNGTLQDEKEKTIREHLEPLLIQLQLGEPDLPIEELARRVANAFWQRIDG